MSQSHLPLVTDEQIRAMAREAEAENLLLPRLEQKPRGWHFRRAAIRLGAMPLCEMTADELAWQFAVRIARAAVV